MLSIIKKIRILLLQKSIWRNYSFGKNFHVGRGVHIWGKSKITIGDHVYIGRYSQIECDTEIGNNVVIANCVAFVGRYDHNFEQLGIPIRFAEQIRNHDYQWKGLGSKVIIEDDVWIGYGSIILSGVKVKKGAIVAAGSVVTKDVEPYAIVAGNPASFVKNRFSKQEQEEHEEKLKKYH